MVFLVRTISSRKRTVAISSSRKCTSVDITTTSDSKTGFPFALDPVVRGAIEKVLIPTSSSFSDDDDDRDEEKAEVKETFTTTRRIQNTKGITALSSATRSARRQIRRKSTTAWTRGRSTRRSKAFRHQNTYLWESLTRRGKYRRRGAR